MVDHCEHMINCEKCSKLICKHCIEDCDGCNAQLCESCYNKHVNKCSNCELPMCSIAYPDKKLCPLCEMKEELKVDD